MESMLGERTSPAEGDWQILQFPHPTNRRKLTTGCNGATIRDGTMDLLLLLVYILVSGGSGGGGK